MAGENIRTVRREQTKNGPRRHVALLSTKKLEAKQEGKLLRRSSRKE
jgi:hypothetical protein